MISYHYIIPLINALNYVYVYPKTVKETEKKMKGLHTSPSRDVDTSVSTQIC